MVPVKAGSSTRKKYLRMLILGVAKIGKTVAAVTTAPGPVYVINCDNVDALEPAERRTKNFSSNLVAGPEDMEAAMKVARQLVKDGKVKTIVVDTLSNYAARLEESCLKASGDGDMEKADGRRAYWNYESRLRNQIERLFKLDAHVIVCSHYLEIPGKLDTQLDKFGDGIAPLLAGKARGTIPGLFNDVVFMFMKRDKRMFGTSPTGAWGKGCRTLEGYVEVAADIGEFLRLAAKAEGKSRQSVAPIAPHPAALARGRDAGAKR
jgi:AAA domain